MRSAVAAMVTALAVVHAAAGPSTESKPIMEQRDTSEQVDALLGDLDSAEPTSFDLGTPEVFDVEAVRELVRMGPSIVPLLLERIGQGAPTKRTAYLVLALNRIGDSRALAPLLDLRAAYQARADKDEWDHAVIGQANLAIEQLRGAP